MPQRLLFNDLKVLIAVTTFVILVRSDCLKVRDDCLENMTCSFAIEETSKPDVCGDASLGCLFQDSQKIFCRQMLEMLRRDFHLDQCTCDPGNRECHQFNDMITRHPCEVREEGDGLKTTIGSKSISNGDPSSSYDYFYTEENPDKIEIDADIAATPMTKSENEQYSLDISYDTDISSGSSYISSDDNLSDCWTEVNRCRRRDSGGACSKSFSTFEIACSCDDEEPYACASDAPKCQEARNMLDEFSLVNCDCPEYMPHRKRCQFVYDKLFNNPCIDGCKDYFVQSDTALNARILPYQDAISKCTEAEGGCIDYLVELSAACYNNCSQTKCQQATGDFVKHVDPMISHSILFTDCNGSNSGPDCVDTISKIQRKCAVTVTPMPNCLELPIRCQGILGCQLQFRNFENHCDPNRCSQDVYKSCRTAYTALLSTPIAINCTCDPDAVHFSQCRGFQRRVFENSCVDRAILFFQDPSFEEKKEHGTCTVKLEGDTSLLRIKMDTVIRISTSDGQSSLCQCKADGQLGYCHVLPIMQNVSCDDNRTTENDELQRNDICTCFAGEVICSKPRNGIDADQLDNGQVYLSIGYSVKEYQYINEYTGVLMSEEVFKKQLQGLLDEESQPTSMCKLVLVPLKTRGHLMFKSFEEGGDRKQTSVTCIGALMKLASMINGWRMQLFTSPVLSVLKVASVDHLDMNSNHPQSLTQSSGTIQHLPRCLSSCIVLLAIIVVLECLH